MGHFMKQEIGVSDAKANLSALLREVREGKHYTIAVRGEYIAVLVPTRSQRRSDASAAAEAMRAFPRVSGVDSRQLSDWVARR